MKDVFDLMLFNSKKYFPNLKLRFKTESLFMKLLSFILFFNPSFKNFVTTIGYTMYYPSKTWIKEHLLSAHNILLHELVHMNDMKKMGKFGHIYFGILYLFPHWLFLLGFPLLLINWKLFLITLIFLVPLPAYFRMKYERRAYMVSLYVMKKMEEILKINYLLSENVKFITRQFTGPNYYFMWIFPSIKKDFDEALIKVERGERPYQDDVFEMIDDILLTSFKY